MSKSVQAKKPSQVIHKKIGWRIVVSLFSGGILALLFVLGPFAGTQEHVISGVGLLAFAVGWAAMALLSRSTDQPQRWAWVPAGTMGLAGAALLLLQPNDKMLDAAGWVWPIALFVLVVWMCIKARKQLKSKVRFWLVYPVFGLLALTAIGGAFQTIARVMDRQAYAMPGRLVDAGGYKLHLYCVGYGSPTVILEASMGETSSMWGWVQPELARQTRTCAYDRAGRGWSEPLPGLRDNNEIAKDLHTALQNANETGPYVLAGHSAGGLYALDFARLFPEQVVGMVLFDATHPEQQTRLASFAEQYDSSRIISALMPSLARAGVGRLVAVSMFADLPERRAQEERAHWATASLMRSQRDEYKNLPEAMRRAGGLKSLGNRPLAVVTAEEDIQEGWMALQNELAELSTNSIHKTVPTVTHASLTESKAGGATSAEAILAVVKAVRLSQPIK